MRTIIRIIGPYIVDCYCTIMHGAVVLFVEHTDKSFPTLDFFGFFLMFMIMFLEDCFNFVVQLLGSSFCFLLSYSKGSSRGNDATLGGCWRRRRRRGWRTRRRFARRKLSCGQGCSIVETSLIDKGSACRGSSRCQCLQMGGR